MDMRLESSWGEAAHASLAFGHDAEPPTIFGGDRQGDASQRGAPEYFENVSTMVEYFGRVKAAVCNYSEADHLAIVRELEQLGATVERYTGACTHLLTPYRSGPEYAAAVREGKTVVSYAWLEDCLAARRVLSPSAKVLYAPIQDAQGVPGMAACVLAASGYTGPARADIRELAEAAGAAFSGALTRATTHLVCYRPDAEVYTKALLARLEGRPLEIVNHTWLEDCVRAWARQPEGSEAYRRLGCEVDADARVAAERARCAEAEAAYGAEARRSQQAAAAAASACEGRAHAQAHAAALAAELQAARGGCAAEASQADALAQQLQACRGDVEALQALLHGGEAARAHLHAQLAAADADRRAAAMAVEAATGAQAQLAQQFARSRGDLLARLEARQKALEALTAQLEGAHAAHAGAQAQLSEEQALHRATAERLEAERRRCVGLADSLAACERDRASVGKQLEAERKSRLHVLSDYENERRQREHLLRQLDAEQKLRLSLQKAVAAKDAGKLRAEEELETQGRELGAMAAELDRLRAFEPRHEDPDSRVQVKLFLDEEIRFLEVDAECSFEQLTAAVGKVVAESYRLAFEDEDQHRITLRGGEDLKIALRQFDKSGLPYLKLVLERGAEAKKRGIFTGFGKASTKSKAAASLGGGSDAGSEIGSQAPSATVKRK